MDPESALDPGAKKADPDSVMSWVGEGDRVGLGWGGAKKKSRGRSRRQSEGARRVRGARSGRGRVRREGYARERGSEVGKGVL